MRSAMNFAVTISPVFHSDPQMRAQNLCNRSRNRITSRIHAIAGCGLRAANEIDDRADHLVIAQNAAVSEAFGGDEMGGGPEFRELFAALVRGLVVLSIVNDEKRDFHPRS